jgi:hypothetical protein
MNPLRTTGIATYAAANPIASSWNARGILADMTRLISISTSISTRTAGRSGCDGRGLALASVAKNRRRHRGASSRPEGG